MNHFLFWWLPTVLAREKAAGRGNEKTEVALLGPDCRPAEEGSLRCAVSGSCLGARPGSFNRLHSDKAPAVHCARRGWVHSLPSLATRPSIAHAREEQRFGANGRTVNPRGRGHTELLHRAGRGSQLQARPAWATTQAMLPPPSCPSTPHASRLPAGHISPATQKTASVMCYIILSLIPVLIHCKIFVKQIFYICVHSSSSMHKRWKKPKCPLTSQGKQNAVGAYNGTV